MILWCGGVLIVMEMKDLCFWKVFPLLLYLIDRIFYLSTLKGVYPLFSGLCDSFFFFFSWWKVWHPYFCFPVYNAPFGGAVFKIFFVSFFKFWVGRIIHVCGSKFKKYGEHTKRYRSIYILQFCLWWKRPLVSTSIRNQCNHCLGFPSRDILCIYKKNHVSFSSILQKC